MDTRVINLYGGPGTGKSTTCAGVFFALKTRNISCEMATEYAKDIVWEGSTSILQNQLYVFAAQHRRIYNLQNKVRYIITDSPLLNSLMYGKHMSHEFKALVKAEYRRFDNIDIFLERCKPYHAAGRLQTEEQAKDLDADIRLILLETGNHFFTLPATQAAPSRIISEILFSE